MARDITKTPIKLYPVIARMLTTSASGYSEDLADLIRRFRGHLEDPGKLTFAVNEILRDLAIRAGLKVGEIETPNRRMSQAQKRRWRAAESREAEGEEKAEAQRQARRERNAKRKAEQSASTPEQGTEGEADFA